MLNKNGAAESAPNSNEAQSLRKRSHDDVEVEPDSAASPSKRQKGQADEDSGEAADFGVEAAGIIENGVDMAGSLTNGHIAEDDVPKSTPRRRGRPPKKRSAAPTTPVKASQSEPSTPKREAADRSARKKSARTLIEQAIGVGDSDDEQDEDVLAREIYESSEDDDDDDDVAETEDGASSAAPDEAATPSKTPQRKQRRKRAKSPTPPRDLPPHEQYFLQNKPGRPKTSNNSLASLALLSHEEYFDILRNQEDRHEADVENLESLHAESFPQWAFELKEGFSLCLYGFGSKRRLLRKFAEHLHSHGYGGKNSKIIVVNGYTPTTTMREVLSLIGKAMDPTGKLPTSQPTVMVQSILSQLSSLDITLTLIINSIDAAPLRKPSTQAILAELASHAQVHLVCSADTPDFPLLWDVGARSAFNFAFRDCTTFAPFRAELDVVDEVHELLGRKARRVNGKEGVAFVLRSLPENARNLFCLLVGEVLLALDEDGSTNGEEAGVEYRMLYNKAVEEFICTSEMAFRTLLKEYASPSNHIL